MKGFEKAKKKSKCGKKWYLVRCGNDYVYVWGLPLYPLYLLSKKIDKWQYERMRWTEKRANRILDKTLPKILSYDESANEYYYYVNGSGALYDRHNIFIFDRRWVRKYYHELKEHLINKYEHPKYIKSIVEADYYDEMQVVFKEKAE